MTYETVIGLEVHVQLDTRTKLFCSCAAAFGEEPNTLTCPVCTGQPGVLPVLNRRALDLAVMAGLALDCTVARRTMFARKHYFYPDLPKGYQVSQYDQPVAFSGFLEVGPNRIPVVRVHLEEDAGKTIHPRGARHSLVDLNRAGVPLLEIVSEPAIASPASARATLKELKRIMKYIGVSDCDMEKGSLRCDANISLKTPGAPLGVKTEVKNLNSFRNVEAALAFEEKRQARILASGGRVAQETLLWNAKEERTEVMRTKEEAHDYRYFPEPDLPGYDLQLERVEKLRALLPELPAARQKRFGAEHHLPEHDAEVLTSDRELADYFESCLKAGGSPRETAGWIQSTLLAEMNERGVPIRGLRLPPARLVEVMAKVDQGRLSRMAAKKVITQLIDEDGTLDEAIKALNLEQVSDPEEIAALVEEVLTRCASVAKDYRSGKAAALNALIGQVMKASRGRAHPGEVRSLLIHKIEEIP